MSPEANESSAPNTPSPEEMVAASDALQGLSQLADQPEQKPEETTEKPVDAKSAPVQSPEEMKPAPEKIDVMKEFVGKIDEILNLLTELMRQKFFPQQKEDGTVSVSALDGLNQLAGVEPPSALEGLKKIAGVEKEAEVAGNAGNDKTVEQQKTEAEKVKAAAENRAKDAAANGLRINDLKPYARRAPQSGERRNFYDTEKKELYKAEFDSASGKWIEVADSKKPIDRIREDVVMPNVRKREAEEAARQARIENGNALFKAWRQGGPGQALWVDKQIKMARGERIMNEDATRESWNDLKDRKAALDSGLLPDIDEQPSYSNYTSNNARVEAARQTRHSMERPLTDAERERYTAPRDAELRAQGVNPDDVFEKANRSDNFESALTPEQLAIVRGSENGDVPETDSVHAVRELMKKYNLDKVMNVGSGKNVAVYRTGVDHSFILDPNGTVLRVMYTDSERELRKALDELKSFDTSLPPPETPTV